MATTQPGADGVYPHGVPACRSCGEESPDGLRFCGYCGATLAAPAVERRRLATSVFCDLTGSTAMGEQVDAESVLGLMRSYFDVARSALERHGGTVEKFIGDAVVGMFGVPETHEDDALRACRAAHEIQQRIAALNLDLAKRFGTGIAVRIGVNTGEVVTGDAAKRAMFASGDAVVLGDSVNVAARLEQAASPGEVLLGDATFRLVRDVVEAETVGPITVKGKSKPVVAHRLLDVSPHSQMRPRRGTPLVGRRHELALLTAEFETADAAGRCRVVTVVGEPGVGKSRLADELEARIAHRARVVRGRCLSYGEGITFWAVGEIVRDLAGIRDDHSLEEARALLEPSGPVVANRLAQLLGLGEGSATAEQIEEAVAQFLVSAAQELPLVVVVEDIHWAEPALLDLLAGLPDEVADAPVLVVCLTRPELLETRPDWPVTVRLEPLRSDEIHQLLGSLGAPPEVEAQLAQAAAGNPLFAEELASWVAEGGDADALPTSLNALLGARLDRLDPKARDALERGAVEGELFHRGAVVALSEEASRPLVPAGLDELTRKDLVLLAAASLAGEVAAYRFKHILVREATYNATAKRLRAGLHERFADWLERIAGQRVGEYDEILGYHYEQAFRYRSELGPVDDEGRQVAARAARHLGTAGRRANDRADVRAAANLLRRATALLPENSLERLELMPTLVYAVDQTGMMREAQAISTELYERAAALGEERLAAHGKLYATPNPFFDNEARSPEASAAAETAYREVIETFEKLGDGAGVAAGKRRLALVFRTRSQLAQSITLLEDAFAYASRAGDPSTFRAVAFSLSNDLCVGPLPVDVAITRCEALLAASRDDRVLEAAISRHLGHLMAMASRFDEARALVEAAASVLDKAWVESASWGSLGSAAGAMLLYGDREGAKQAWLAKWRAYPVEDGKTQGLAINACYALASMCCDEGRWAEAEEYVRRYRATSPNDRLEARLAAHRGDLDRARSLARAVVDRFERSDSPNGRAVAWTTLAEVERAAGNTDAANAAAATAIAFFEQKGNIAAAEQLRASALEIAPA